MLVKLITLVFVPYILCELYSDFLLFIIYSNPIKFDDLNARSYSLLGICTGVRFMIICMLILLIPRCTNIIQFILTILYFLFNLILVNFLLYFGYITKNFSLKNFKSFVTFQLLGMIVGLNMIIQTYSVLRVGE